MLAGNLTVINGIWNITMFNNVCFFHSGYRLMQSLIVSKCHHLLGGSEIQTYFYPRVIAISFVKQDLKCRHNIDSNTSISTVLVLLLI